MSYCITDGKNYIGDYTNFVLVEDIEKAAQWKSIEKCKKVIKNSLQGRAPGTNWIIKSCGDSNVEQFEAIHVDVATVIETQTDKSFKDLCEIYKQLCARKSGIDRELRIVEKEILDIRHAIEFYDLSASKGFKMYKLLQSKLRERRVLKDEMLKLKSLDKIIPNERQLLRMEATLNGFHNRKYEPRVMAELFSDK